MKEIDTRELVPTDPAELPMDRPSDSLQAKCEQRAILITVFGNLFMAALGLGFALATRSQAILLDGVYSLIGFGLALTAIRVSTLVLRPDDEKYPFGYVFYEPILNFTKGLLIGAVSVFALIAAVISLVTGGRDIAEGMAFCYATGAAVGCFLFAFVLKRKLRHFHSPLVRTDIHNWLVDGGVSLAVGFAFLVAMILSRFGFSEWVPYVDPLVTALVCLVLMPIPYKILRENWAQIVARSAPIERISEVEAILDDCLPEAKILAKELRVLESGRVLLIHLYLCVEDSSIRECDDIRAAIWERLQGRYAHPALDVSFTSDPKWFRHASGDK